MKIIFIVIVLLFIAIGYVLFSTRQNVNKVYPSVVHIECKNDNTTTVGSGIIYDTKNGKHYIVTNYHIIKGYTNIYIHDEKLNSQKAAIINYDEDNDIAVLSVSDKLEVKKATFDFKKKLEEKEEAYVLTSYVGKDLSYITKEVTIFSKNENIKLNNTIFSVIKIRGNVEKGDSGSALIDKRGKVIGMIFLKDKVKKHMGYALPINMVLKKVEILEKKVEGLNLGALMVSSQNKMLLEEYNISNIDRPGVIIISVKKNYPLYNSGLKKGDLIVKFNKKEINEIDDLKNEVKRLKLNDEVLIEYYRGNEFKKTSIKLAK